MPSLDSVSERLASATTARLPSQMTFEPTPACYGSYSKWAGKAQHWHIHTPLITPSAAFADETKRFADSDGSAGHEGDYDPHRHTGMAATATFSHNKKLLGADARDPSSSPCTSTGIVPQQSPLELFPLNRLPLREGGPVPTGGAQMPQAWVEGARAAGEVAAQAIEDQSGPSSAAAHAASSTALACTSSALSLAPGPHVSALTLKQEREERAAEERQAKWEARHGGRSKIPAKPLPPPGAGSRASERLFATATTSKYARDKHCSLEEDQRTTSRRVDVSLDAGYLNDQQQRYREQYGQRAGQRGQLHPSTARPLPPADGLSPSAPSKPSSPHSASTDGAAPRPPPPRPSSSPSRVVRRHPQTRNYYAVLKLSHDATEAEIKQAYHRLAKLYQPDRNPDERAERTFKLIARAYQVLGDKRTRRAFDRGENVDAKFGRNAAV